MYSVAIEKFCESEAGAMALLQGMEKVTDAVRERAFGHFLDRGGILGQDMDDWLRAERELVWTPGAEMTEDRNSITLRVGAPGLEPRQIKVTATPNSILIQGHEVHKHEGKDGRTAKDGKVCFCDFERQLLRRVDLPVPIEVEKITATLDKGILQIVAPKTQSATAGRAVPVTARSAA